MNQLKNIGEWLVLQRAGMSQLELAEKAGITQEQLSNIESGNDCPISVFIKILMAIGKKIEISLPFPDGGIKKMSDLNKPFDYF